MQRNRRGTINSSKRLRKNEKATALIAADMLQLETIKPLNMKTLQKTSAFRPDGEIKQSNKFPVTTVPFPEESIIVQEGFRPPQKKPKVIYK